MDHPKIRRSVIKKLDFENCEVTTVRTRKGYRKRLKARVTTYYEDEDHTESQQSRQTSCQQQSTDVDLPSSPSNSPILFRKGCSQRRTVPETPSPVLIRKQGSTLKTSTVKDKPQSAFGESTNTTSPVFKLKLSSGKMKKARSSEIPKLDKSKPSYEIVTDDDYSPDEYVIEDFSSDECVIEDFSQEFKKETDEECKISNFSSESKVDSTVNTSEDQSRETLSKEAEPFNLKTPTKTETDNETLQVYDSGKKRKRNKKGGLVEKLVTLRKRLASEKRIREHMKNIMKIKVTWKRNFHVVNAWKEGERLTLKCQQMEVSQDGALTNCRTDFTYIILNRDIGHLFDKIQKGTLFRIAAPWQEVRLQSHEATVLLGVTCIELIDTVPGSITNPPDISIPQKQLKEVSVAEYKEDEALLFDKIFASE